MTTADAGAVLSFGALAGGANDLVDAVGHQGADNDGYHDDHHTERPLATRGCATARDHRPRHCKRHDSDDAESSYDVERYGRGSVEKNDDNRGDDGKRDTAHHPEEVWANPPGSVRPLLSGRKCGLVQTHDTGTLLRIRGRAAAMLRRWAA